MSDATDAFAHLARSTHRVVLLETIRDDGPLSRCDLVDRLDASRPTVDRNLDALAERGWITANAPPDDADDGTETEYRLTALGRTAADSLCAFRDRMDVAVEIEPFLRRLPADAFDLGVRHLADAELVVASDRNPYAPIERLRELRRESLGLRQFVSIVTKNGAEQVRQMASGSGNEPVELVLEAGVLAGVRDDPSYETVADVLAGDDADCFRYDGEFPFGIVLLDEYAVFVVIDERHMPHSILASDDDRVYEWAERLYERTRAQAEPIDSEDL